MEDTDTVLVPGDVTEIVMLPTAPELVDAVNATVRLSAAALGGAAPGQPERHPIVQLAPEPEIVPMAASAVTVTVVPAAIGLPFASCTVKLIVPTLVTAGVVVLGLIVRGLPPAKPGTLAIPTFATDVDMIIK